MHDQPEETQPGVEPPGYVQLSDAVNRFSSGRLRIHHHVRDDSPLLRQTFKHPDAALDNATCQIVKSDRTTTVGTVSLDGKRFVIKRYNTKNLWHRVRRSVRQSRAENCWHFGHLLHGLGVPTAPAVAWIQESVGPLNARSWFISDFIEGPTCQDYLTSEIEFTQAKIVLHRIVEVWKTLRDHRISHGDMKASNILLRWERPLLVDLDAMRQHRSRRSYQDALESDVQRFLKNWQKSPQLLEASRKLLASEKFPV